MALGTLKPPAVPSLLTSTVPGFGVLHMLQVFRRAQLVFPQPLHVQSPAANMPAPPSRELKHVESHQLLPLSAVEGSCGEVAANPVYIHRQLQDPN